MFFFYIDISTFFFIYRYQYVFIDISVVFDYRTTALVLHISFIDLNYNSAKRKSVFYCTVFCSYI